MKRLLLSLLCGAALTLAATPAAAQSAAGAADSTSAQARLLIEADGAMRRVQGVFANEDTPAGELTYRLTVEKDGASGRSTSRQSGAFETAPGRADTLSQASVGVQPGDRLHLRLSILNAGQAVAEARVDTTLSSP